MLLSLRSPSAVLIAVLLLAGHALAQAPAAAPAAPAPAPAAPAPAAMPTAPAPATPALAAATPASEQAFDLAAALREGSALSADDAAAQAVKSSPSAARARAATEAANNAATAAYLAVYPRLDLEASYTRLSEHDPATFGRISTDVNMTPMDTTDDVISTFSTPDAIEDQIALQARLTYPVSDLFFTILPRYDAQRQLAELQLVREKAADQTVALQAKEAYYAYVRARAAKLIADSALAQTEAQRRDVEALVKGGALARVELMRAEAQVATARVAVARAQGNVGVAGTALRSLMHVEGGAQQYAVTEDLTQPLPALTRNQADVLALALANRSELKALRAMSDAQDKSVSAENGGKLPKLSVGATVDLANPNQRVAPYEQKFEASWALVGTLSWSPNDYVAAEARATQVRVEKMQTEADLRALEDALRTEVAQAYEDYGAAREAMVSALSGIAAAEETYRVRREQFRAGSAVARDVIDAETDLRRARLELVSAAIDARIAVARMDRAMEGAGGVAAVTAP